MVQENWYCLNSVSLLINLAKDTFHILESFYGEDSLSITMFLWQDSFYLFCLVNIIANTDNVFLWIII